MFSMDGKFSKIVRNVLYFYDVIFYQTYIGTY